MEHLIGDSGVRSIFYKRQSHQTLWKWKIMDAATITISIFINLISSLILYLLVRVWKSAQTRREQFSLHQQELEKIFSGSQEYQWIMDRRKSYRSTGSMFLIALLAYIATIIAIYIVARELIFFQIQYALQLMGLVAITYIGFYLGYTPITLQEVEQERQKNRTKAFREALGARPYGYIGGAIILPIFALLLVSFMVIGLLLSFYLPGSMDSFPLILKIVSTVIIIPISLLFFKTVFKVVFWSIKNYPNVPRQRRVELRQQLTNHEFDQ